MDDPAPLERFWRRYSESPRGFDSRMPVICERFRLVYPRPAES